LKTLPISLLTLFLLSAIHLTVLAKISQDNGGITLPVGFRAQVIADDIGKARQIAIRENGDMYASLMDPVDMNYIAAMRDTDGDGRMEFIKYFGELDSSCKGVGLYKGYLYVASRTQVVRFPMEENRLLPTGPFEVVVSGFVPQRGHPHKVFTFDDRGHIYVQIGSPSNACMEQSRRSSSRMIPQPLATVPAHRTASRWNVRRQYYPINKTSHG